MPGFSPGVPASSVTPGMNALGAIGSGIKEGLLAYRQQKQQNFENAKDKGLLAAKGLNYDQESGQFNPSDVIQTQQQNQLAQQKQIQDSLDPDSDYSERHRTMVKGLLDAIKPGSSKSITDDMTADDIQKSGLLPKFIGAEGSLAGRQGTIDVMRDRMDNLNHQKTVGRLSSNKNLASRLTQLQNLDNTMSIITDTKNLTPQQIDDFQQSLRANLGIRGTSGVDERGKTQYNNLGLNADRLEEFLTGNPSSISRDTKLLQHLQDMGNVERKNAKRQYQKQLAAVTSGNDSMYARRDDLKDDLDKTIARYSDMVGDTTPQQTGGLLQGTPQGQALSPQGGLPPTRDVGGKTWVLNPQTGKYR